MKFSKFSTILALCTVSVLLTTTPSVLAQASHDKPSNAAAPGPLGPLDPTAKPTPTHDSTTAAVPTSHTNAPTSAPHISPSTVPPQPTAKPSASSIPVPPVQSSIAPPTTTSGGLPPMGGTFTNCTNSGVCGGGLCARNWANATVSICVTLPASNKICQGPSAAPCNSDLDCNDGLYTMCALYNGAKTCAGLGEFQSCNTDPQTNNLTATIKYAGIAVGSVAALAIVFAMVRWQRRRQRSKMPADMFGEVNYGMTDRSSAPPVSKAAALSEPYPFSSRPHAHGSDRSHQDNYSNHGHGGGGYDDQYYEEPVGYNAHGGGGYGHDQYDNHGGHHGGDDGFYDNQGGYDDYNHHPGQSHLSPVSMPARTASPHHYNNNDDYGGHGGQGGGGYGGRY
ncbi:hypothetical protein BGZ83_004300 [Gryganskiella cystojenkinii]|nr:hypothetical protein BGZ83_004300 [Gryganskiella cystojenkinii]